MSCCAISKRSIGQPFPKSDPRTILVDTALPQMLNTEVGKVFSYKLTSVEREVGKLVQHGCGPNFQGDRITLCTCMRYHRTWPSIGKGTWIAGFTKNASLNQLFYLMKVEHVAENFSELWHSEWLPIRRAKSTHYDVFGDVYEPLSSAAARHPHDPAMYRPPIAHHKHGYANEWHKDIRRFRSGRPHKLLVGKPGRSFVWQHPRYAYKNQPHPRFRFYKSVAEFLKDIK